MADFGPVQAALDSVKASVDSVKATVDSYTKQAADEAVAAWIAAHPAPAPVPAPTPTPTPAPTPTPSPLLLHEFSDFTANGGMAGVVLGNTGSLSGQLWRMKPNTSSKLPYVDSLVGVVVNQLRLILTGSYNSAVVPTGIKHLNFEIQGTPQGHPYHAVQAAYSDGMEVQGKVRGIAGYSSSPPGELMMWEFYRSINPYMHDSDLDGRDVVTGAPVGATALQMSYVGGNPRIVNTKMRYAQAGFATALWECSGNFLYSNCQMGEGNRKAINVEASMPGASYEFDGCDFRGLAFKTWHCQVSTKAGTTGSAKIIFKDPVTDDGVLRVRNYNPGTGTTGVLDSDIKLYRNGVDVSADKTKLVILHAG